MQSSATRNLTFVESRREASFSSAQMDTHLLEKSLLMNISLYGTFTVEQSIKQLKRLIKARDIYTLQEINTESP
jgi:hypothetical protein